MAARAREGDAQATALQILQESGSGEMLLDDLKAGLGRAIQEREEGKAVAAAKADQDGAAEGGGEEPSKKSTEAKAFSTSTNTASLMAVYSLVAAGLIRIDRESKENTVVSLLA